MKSSKSNCVKVILGILDDKTSLFYVIVFFVHSPSYDCEGLSCL